MKKLATAIRGMLVAAIGCLVTSSSQAEVRITRFDPPLSVGAFSDPAPGLNWNTTAFDFDLDGQTDFRLLYGGGQMTAYFNAPLRYATAAVSLGGPYPVPSAIIFNPDLGPVGAVPLGSLIGSNIVTAAGSNSYWWGAGTTNFYLPELLGDHSAFVINVNLVVPLAQQPFISLSTNGILVTNIYPSPPPFIQGDVVGKEGVMALQFYLGNDLHYGYIHFNFKGGGGGDIYGFAYETEPDVPIQAMPLLLGEKLNKRKILLEINPVQRHPH